MREQKQIGLLARLQERMSLWMIMAFAELAAIILLLMLCIGLNQPTKVIVTPPDMRRAFWVQGEKLDPNYISDMARFFAADLLTYSPDNAAGQFEDVLKYVDPSLANVLRRQLMTDLEDIRSKARSSVFWIKEVKVEKDTVYLMGIKRDMMSGAVIGDSIKGYKFRFAMKNRLVVTGFEEIPGMMQGGLAEWQRGQQAAEAQAAASEEVPTEQAQEVTP